MTRPLEEREDDLYSLPLERFVAERDALAAELRSTGDVDEAARVKALRKPTRAAWAVNQLVRSEPDLLESLLGAGGELRQAHRQAAAGRGARQLRAAAAAERDAVEQLVARAASVLGAEPAPALADSVRRTLNAASSDDQARELVAAGRVIVELRAIGFPAPRRPQQ
jgi:hypothetical protein